MKSDPGFSVTKVGGISEFKKIAALAQAGARGQLEPAVAGLDGAREERGLLVAGGELDRQRAAERGGQVQGGGQPRPEIEGVRGDRQVGGLGERGDLLELGDPAHLGDARLQDVAGPLPHDLAEAVHGGLVLAERDGSLGGGGHPREPRVVLRRPHRLFQPEQAIGRERPRHRDGLEGRPRAVGVEHQLHVGAHRLPGRAHRGHVGLVELQHPEALRHEVPAGPRHRVRCLVAQETRVGGQARAQGPAQQLVDRRAAHLAEQVPQRDLDAADREHPEPTPPVDHGPAMHQVDHRLDAQRVLADDQRRQALLDDAHHRERRAVGEGLAEPGDALVGVHPHEDLLAGAAGPGRRRVHRPERDGERHGLDGGDLHGGQAP